MQGENELREGWKELLMQGEWKLKVDARATTATSLREIDRKTHDWLHKIERSMGISVVSMGIAVMRDGVGHCHLLVDRYERGASFQGTDLGAMARLWKNGSRWAEDDCKVELIESRERSCGYATSKRNLILDELPHMQSGLIEYRHPRLDRYLKRHQQKSGTVAGQN